MKSLLLENMLLVSHREKKARKIEFHPELTVIKGENDTGKSSVIKSIQYAFGANPHKRHKKWKDADIAILIRFSIDGVPYSIYRHRDSFTLFDNDRNQIGTYSSVTHELAPVLAKIFDFNLKLSDRDGIPVTPPPAYLMLPFYIDQDKGWTDSWSSFTNLGQFAYWKQRVTGYHFGIRPDKWYELEAQKKKLESDKDEPLRQVMAINSVRDRAYEEMSRTDFDMDIERFKKEINQLLDECERLKLNEIRYRDKITNLRTEKIRLEAQIDIVTRTHDELSEDYKYSCQSSEDSIGCPTCGTYYNNSFSERFEIAKDAETCTDLLASLREDFLKVDKEIIEVSDSLDNANNDQVNIKKLLSTKQGQVKLKDLIDIEGKKSLIDHLDNELGIYQENIKNIEISVGSIVETMEKFDDSDRRKKIISEYGEILSKFTQKLGVFSLSDNVFKNINASIEESGSDLPRALLAYFFTALKLILKNGNATFFPIVIDAPNQQEQDPKNLRKMLEFILASRPLGKQLILGLVDDSGVEFNGKVINFSKKYSVLLEEEYDAVASEMRHYENINLTIQD